MEILVMILIPVVFFIFMALVFSTTLNTGAINTQLDVLDNPIPNYSNSTYSDSSSWSFGFGVFRYFADVISTVVSKAIATLTLMFLAITPPSSLPFIISGSLFFFIYLPLYIILGIGIYKAVSPFV